MCVCVRVCTIHCFVVITFNVSFSLLWLVQEEACDAFLSYCQCVSSIHSNVVVYVVEEQVSDQLETAKNPNLEDVVSYTQHAHTYAHTLLLVQELPNNIWTISSELLCKVFPPS